MGLFGPGNIINNTINSTMLSVVAAHCCHMRIAATCHMPHAHCCHMRPSGIGNTHTLATHRETKQA